LRELDLEDCYDFWGFSDNYFADCFEASKDDVSSKESLALITLEIDNRYGYRDRTMTEVFFYYQDPLPRVGGYC
jgi:hypothetical protein